jgi:hypothetical protein
MRSTLGLAICFLTSLGGCAHNYGVRYVYQDRDFGVVGMPENTDCWPTHYRRHAKKLMDAQFPDGFEIVRAEEVIEGERTVKVEGSSSAEVSPQISTSVLKVVDLGHSTSRSEQETVKVKECRMIYRRTNSGTARGYASATTLSPTLYVDPNAAERQKAKEPPREKAKAQEEPKMDDKASRPPDAPLKAAERRPRHQQAG